MIKITEQGTYQDLDADTYHSNCCPSPALSAGFIHDLDEGSPAQAWFASSMNPNLEREEKTAFEIGEAAHLLFLEPHRFEGKTLIIESDSYRTKDAQASRDTARANKLVPLLTKQRDMLFEMRRALFNELEGLPFLTAPMSARQAVSGGVSESSYFWVDRATGIWCKARPDHVTTFTDRADVLIDYKTSAPWQGLDRYALTAGWHSRAAFYIDGHTALTGRPAEYWYLIQSKEPPYFVRMERMKPEAIAWGRKICRRSAWLFAECLDSGAWPSGVETPGEIGIPPWAEMQLNEREERGDFKPRQM